jgi:hypothetical protein
VYQDLIVDAVPDPVGISGSSIAFPGKSYSYSVSSTLNNDSYQWTASGGSVTLGQGITQVSASFGIGGGTLSVVSTNSKCGNSVARSLAVLEAKMNYVREDLVKIEGVTSESQVDGLPVENKNSSATYLDGLGRTIQSLSWQSSPGKNDIIAPSVYDDFGREYRKYLPASMNEGTGYYRPDLLDASSSCTVNTYSNPAGKIASDPMPYAQTSFEPSPLNRVVKQGAVGSVWQPDNNLNSTTDKTVKHHYEANEASDVMLLVYDTASGLVSNSNYYAANQLHANRTTDEHGNDVIEYIDKLGRTVCKRVQYNTDSSGSKLYTSTYYIYDDIGNLVVVLPPEAALKFATK